MKYRNIERHLVPWQESDGEYIHLAALKQALPGQSTDHLCMCQAMTDKTEGLEVVAWQHVFTDGRIVSYSEDQAGFPARDDALKVEPLVTLTSAQAAVAAERKLWEEATLAIKAIGDANADSDCARITALDSLVRKVHTAKGRYHTQIAMCDLYDSVGFINERPKK